jgi:antitoxin (DNA-binding transcriptional repressor) of toxin-antitoxin stability system
MKKIDLTEANEPLAEYVKRMEGNLMIITFRGVALAALVPLDNIDYETVSLSTNPEFIEILEQSRKRVRGGRGIKRRDAPVL